MTISAATSSAIEYSLVSHSIAHNRFKCRVSAPAFGFPPPNLPSGIKNVWHVWRRRSGPAALMWSRWSSVVALPAMLNSGSLLVRIGVDLNLAVRLLEKSQTVLAQPITIATLAQAYQQLTQALDHLTQARQRLTAPPKPSAKGAETNQLAVTLLNCAISTLNWMLSDIADRHISKASPLLPMAQQVKATLVQLINDARPH